MVYRTMLHKQNRETYFYKIGSYAQLDLLIPKYKIDQVYYNHNGGWVYPYPSLMNREQSFDKSITKHEAR